MRLATLAWTDLPAPSGPLLLVPLGATEQHGPHLPMNTDSVIAEALTGSIADGRTDRIAGPTLHYGSSGEHAAFPGTLSLGQAALELAVVELVRSADYFRGVAIVCWHGGNAEALSRATQLLHGEGRRIQVWRGHQVGGDLHAGRTETSLMLHLAPELVGKERPAGATEPLVAIKDALMSGGVRHVSPNGVLGDAAGA